MAWHSRVPCRHPGCPALIPYGERYCAEHKKLHTDENRSAGKRGYGSRWQKESRKFLEGHPLCAECMRNGRYVKATVVDHVRPHRGDPLLFWDRGNWQALCKPCHDRKTGNEDTLMSYGYRK